MTEPEDNEAVLLASVGGSVKEMSTYEDSVIRDAELQTAPKLTGTGFPDLAPLSPSFDARAGTVQNLDVPQVYSILNKIRGDIANENGETRRKDVLRLKEQMLLVYLRQVAHVPIDEMPVSLPREMALEQKRKIALESTRYQKLTERPSKIRNKKSVVSFEDDTLSTIQRLEEIKRNGGVCHNIPDSLERRKSLLKTRTSMMKRKKLNVEDDDDVVERRRLMRERRDERKVRRRQRQKHGMTQEEADEFEFDDGAENDDCSKPAGIEVIQSNSPVINSIINGRDENEKNAGFVSCPICNGEVAVAVGTTADEFLSQHIDNCQRRGTRTTRNRGRISYDEEVTASKTNPGYRSIRSQMPRIVIKKKSEAHSNLGAVMLSVLDDIEEWRYEDRVDDWIDSGLGRMREMKERDESELPPGAQLYPGDLLVPAWVNNRLFPYQRTALRWLWELHQQEAGGIVGDEMGLGKTVQICAYLGAMAASRKMNSALVICPATMLSHWLKELSVWSPGLRRLLIHKSGEADGRSRTVSTQMLKSLDQWLQQARADRVNEVIDEEDFLASDEDSFCGTGYVVVTTYENIRRFPDVWTNHIWSYAIIDEGQKIRNPEADVTLACKRLRTPHRLLLSGTPIQNDLKELWSLFDFVMPGRLGVLGVFEKEFSDPIKRAGYSNASPMQVQLGYRCALTLRDMINPYLLRRRKNEVKEVSRMPGKTEQVLFCRLSQRQRSIYEAYLQSDEVVNILRGSPQLFRSITVLRKICNHPDLVCEPDQTSFDSFVRSGHNRKVTSDSDESSGEFDIDMQGESLVQRAGKLEVLAKILPLWKKQGHRVLIFCQWKKMLSIIEGFTRLQGWKFGRMDGNTSVSARQRLVDTFNEDQSYFGLLLTTRTGGVGLNLTGADRIILYDPDWNPQTDAQARERAWRFGQKNAVTVYRLITAGTIEEKIYQRQIFKTALTNKVLQDPRQRRLFSQRDLKDLFTLKSDDGSIIQGGQGTTETGELTKGVGVVDADEAFAEIGHRPNKAAKDNNETLGTLLKSRGLAGVFDHDFVEQNEGQKKSSIVLEMEERAIKVAQDAVRALRESTVGGDRFQPTWTGSEQTDTGRFGFSNPSSTTRTRGLNGLNPELSFGGAGSAGVFRSQGLGVGSAGLLTGLLGQNSKVPGSESDKETKQYATLIKEIQAFVKRFEPSTDEILKEFDSVRCDPSIFRRLLKSVAVRDRGKWKASE